MTAIGSVFWLPTRIQARLIPVPAQHVRQDSRVSFSDDTSHVGDLFATAAWEESHKVGFAVGVKQQPAGHK